jgi:hypothetical protein
VIAIAEVKSILKASNSVAKKAQLAEETKAKPELASAQGAVWAQASPDAPAN